MSSDFADDVQFVGLVQAATAAADAQRNLGKRKREEDIEYAPVPEELAMGDRSQGSTLSSSASVLFREPSEKSKKYSRPPLGKVYTSLELAPETFLRLQNAAKAYMLDDDHVERREVVGHKKHTNNNDVAKLKLWQCVDEFLRTDSNGENFFGHSAGMGIPDAPPRTFFWPEDHQRIIKLCMPLLRKMVTNERQRIYAAETRKQDTPKVERQQKSMTADSEMGDVDTSGLRIDPSLDQITSDSKENADEPSSDLAHRSVLLRVNLVSSEPGVPSKRICPEITLPSETTTTLPLLFEEIQKHHDIAQFKATVKVWMPEGLLTMHEDGEWMRSHSRVVAHDWMDSQLKVIVEV